MSRAGYKLLSAVSWFGYDFTDKTVLDIGSSTGGFTQVALLLGAKSVIAIEKGTKQMSPALLSHPGLQLYEKTDFLSLEATNFPAPDVILADVSFISLTKILECAIIKGWTVKNPAIDFLVMLKPQFEASSSQLHNGVVKNSQIRRLLIKDFENWLSLHRFTVINKRDNTLAGKNGNLERFYWLRHL